MKHDPLSIVDEFLRSPDVQVRKNALTALAVIGNDESISRLLDVALTDELKEVRTRAEEELLSLQDESLTCLTRLFRMVLADKERRRPAYALLGRLRGRGFTVPVPSLTMMQRLQLTAAITAFIYPSRGWQFHPRSFLSALGGGVLGSLLFIVFLTIFATTGTGAEFDAGFRGGLFFNALLLSPLMAVFATQRSVPINFHYDRFVATIIELIWIAVFGCILYPVLVVLALLSGEASTDWPTGQIMVSLIQLLLFLTTVRAGTLIASGIFAKRRANLYAEVAVGTAFSIVAITAVDLLFFRVMDTAFISSEWVLYMPLSLGIAAAFARIDEEFVPLKPVMGRAGPVLSVIFLGVLAVWAIVLLIPIPRAVVLHRDNILQAASGKTVQHVWHLRKTPTFIYFHVDFKQNISVQLVSRLEKEQPQHQQEQSYPEGQLPQVHELYLYEANRLIAEGDHREGIETELDPGDYRLETYLYSTKPDKLTPENTLPELLFGFARSLGLDAPYGPDNRTEDQIELELHMTS